MSSIQDITELKQELQSFPSWPEKIDFINHSFTQLIQVESSELKQKYLRSVKVMSEMPVGDEILCEYLLAAYEAIVESFFSDNTPLLKSDGTLGFSAKDEQKGLEFAKILDTILGYYEQSLLTQVTEGTLNLAINSEAVQTEKSKVSQIIREQMEKLIPSALETCQNFSGIALELADPDLSKEHKIIATKSVYEPETQLTESLRNLAISWKQEPDPTVLLKDLQASFRFLRNIYLEKQEAFQSHQRQNNSLQIELLQQQMETVEEIETTLKLLENSLKNLPYLDDQIETLAQSLYQAKSVERFLLELQGEVRDIFKQGNIESFKMIAALNYRMKTRSLEYLAIENYAASIKMEETLKNRLCEMLFQNFLKQNPKVAPSQLRNNIVIQKQVREKARKQIKKLSQINLIIHQGILRIVNVNQTMHLSILEFQKRILSYQKKKTDKDKRMRDVSLLEEQLKVLFLQAHTLFQKIFEHQQGTFNQAQKLFAQFIQSMLNPQPIHDQILACDQALEDTSDKRLINLTAREIATFRTPSYAKNLQRHPEIVSIFNKELIALVMRRHSAIDQTQDSTALRVLIARNLTPDSVKLFHDIIQCLPKRQFPLRGSPGKNLHEIVCLYKESLEKTFSGFIAQSQVEMVQKGPIVKVCRLFHLYLSGAWRNLNRTATETQDFLKQYEKREQIRCREELDLLIDFWKKELNYLMTTPHRDWQPHTYRQLQEKEIKQLSQHLTAKQFLEVEDYLSIPPKPGMNIQGELELMRILESFLQKLKKKPQETIDALTKRQRHALRTKKGNFLVKERFHYLKSLSTAEAKGSLTSDH